MRNGKRIAGSALRARIPLADSRWDINDLTPLTAHGVPGVRHGRKGGSHMRLLMNVTMPHEPFNTAVRDGSVGEKLDRILKETKPEAVYFTERNGHRGAILIFDLADPSKIP